MALLLELVLKTTLVHVYCGDTSNTTKLLHISQDKIAIEDLISKKLREL